MMLSGRSICRRVWRRGMGNLGHADNLLNPTYGRLASSKYVRNYDPLHSGPPPFGMYRAFLAKPSVSYAIRVLDFEVDRDRGWTVFQRALDCDKPPNSLLFEKMMRFCKRFSPSKAPAVLDVAVRRHIAVSHATMRDFLDSCLQTTPPMAREAIDFYRKCGMRGPMSVIAIVEMCKSAGHPEWGIFLVQDSIEHSLEFSHKLVALLAECCGAGAGSPEAADAAEQLLALMPSTLIRGAPERNSFPNLVEALLGDSRSVRAHDVLLLMDRYGYVPSQETYSDVLSSLAQADRTNRALDLLRNMANRKRVANAGSFAELVDSCRRRSDVASVTELHRYANEHSALLLDHRVASAFIGAYGSFADRPALETLHEHAGNNGLVDDESIAHAFESAFTRCDADRVGAPRADQDLRVRSGGRGELTVG
ncbi:unnamed protein product (mitochondrion) [Plasmodiophora brassicae]|uniref:Pentacotripeptide-repeat region of PRORP domain-containing protein n=2 Tax=Plasmodiophora brassicae TaxID=37360 RepID=A0A3P3Y987_PLABS|nr:unnamed protein product [Plasmodiophora brassicae]